MNRYFNTITNTRGDSLPGSQARVLNSSGGVVSIFSDAGGTPISGNLATADGQGVVDFYYNAAAGQTLQILDSAGNVADSFPDLSAALDRGNHFGNAPASSIETDNFTGTIIPNGSDAQEALQALETAVDEFYLEGGAALIGYTPGVTGDVPRSVESRLSETLSLKDFGAVLDGVADDTDALEAWIARAGPDAVLTTPYGICRYTRPQTFPLVQRGTIRGAGKFATTFLADIPGNLSADLWTIGDGVASLKGWTITGIGFDSVQLRTGGAALHAKRMQSGFYLQDIRFGVLSSVTRNLYHGLWCDNVNVGRLIDAQGSVANDCVRLNGRDRVTDIGDPLYSLNDEASDFAMDKCDITFSNCAVRIGGGIGGVKLENVLCYGNGNSVSQDCTLANNFNREIQATPSFVSDATYRDGWVINETYDTAGRNTTIAGTMGSAGKVGGINQPDGGSLIRVIEYGDSNLVLGEGQLFNATKSTGGLRGHGIELDDATVAVSLPSSLKIRNNDGFGVYSSVSTSNVLLDAHMINNGDGSFNANIREFKNNDLTITAASGGSPTSANGYTRTQVTGSRWTGQVLINIVTNGTAAGAIGATIPFRFRENVNLAGHAMLSGKAVYASVAANTYPAVLNIRNYDGSYPGANGETLVLSGIGEVYGEAE